MINRRLIRIKVMQVYYAHYERGYLDIDSALKELDRSVGASLDLYFTLINLLFAFRDIEEEKINIALNKHLPSKEDKNPSRLYLENIILKRIEENKQISEYRANNTFNWHEQNVILKKLWAKFRQSAYFEKYISDNDRGIKSSRKILCDILEKDVAESEIIEQLLEELNIYWNDDLEFIISNIIRFIRGVKSGNDITTDEVNIYQNIEDEEFAHNLLRNTIINNNDFDILIEKHIKNWDLERIALIDRLLLHVALAEFISMSNIPARVTINEFVEISKFYSTEKSSLFINGMLEKIYLEQKQAGNIIKSGRGLVGDI